MLRKPWSESTLARSMSVLSRTDQKKLIVITVIQVLMGGLDLLGIAAVGLLGALSVNNLQSNELGDGLGSVLRILHISGATFETQFALLSAGALFLLVGRTVLSIFSTRRILFFLSRRGAQISTKLISRLLSQPLLTVQSKTTQETLYAVTKGVEVIVLQILATGVVLIADVSLLIIMGIGLFVLDPTTAMGIFLVFLLIGYFIYRFTHVRAGTLGVISSQLNIASNEKIVEVFRSYRESVVRNRRDYYARQIGRIRFSLADTMAEMNFLPYVSKYVIETVVILGTLLVGTIQFISQDPAHAVVTLSVFIAAGTRIAPAVLRVQQGLLVIRGSLGQASPTLDLIQELGNATMIENVDDTVDLAHEGFTSEIVVNGVSFNYPDKTKLAINEITLVIPSGTSVAIVGSSGAGKTTLIDILLGVLNPDTGSVQISGLPPLEAIARWPGSISYVPQDIVIISGTVRENVALGYPPEAATDELIMRSLRIAQLDKFVEDLTNGIDTQVGEYGTKISGGQRQRLGIARAMFTNPHILVLDEATSSLDGETEASITESINSLRGFTTVVVIAHRLSTIRHSDLVVYLSDGKVSATGTFEEVRKAVPDFDTQAKLMGL